MNVTMDTGCWAGLFWNRNGGLKIFDVSPHIRCCAIPKLAFSPLHMRDTKRQSIHAKGGQHEWTKYNQSCTCTCISSKTTANTQNHTEKSEVSVPNTYTLPLYTELLSTLKSNMWKMYNLASTAYKTIYGSLNGLEADTSSCTAPMA